MIEFTINSMTCRHCVSTVTQAVKQIDPKAEVAIDLASHKVHVRSTQDREAIRAALAEAGHAPDRGSTSMQHASVRDGVVPSPRIQLRGVGDRIGE